MKPYLLRIIATLTALGIFVPAAWSAGVDNYDSSEGHWVQVEAKCMIPGPANQPSPNIRIEGKYKQYQAYTFTFNMGGCCYPDSSYCLGPESLPPSASCDV